MASPAGALVAALSLAAVAFALGAAVAGESTGIGPDQTFEGAVTGALGDSVVSAVLAAPTEPWAVLGVLAVMVGLGLGRGRVDVVTLAVVAPALAAGLNTWWWKPWSGRYYDDHLAYPSGHTVGLVTALAVVVLVAAPGRARRRVLLAGALLLGSAAVGLAGSGHHYATDVVGGAAVAVATTLSVAVAVDRALVVLRRRSARGAG